MTKVDLSLYIDLINEFADQHTTVHEYCIHLSKCLHHNLSLSIFLSFFSFISCKEIRSTRDIKFSTIAFLNISSRSFVSFEHVCNFNLLCQLIQSPHQGDEWST